MSVPGPTARTSHPIRRSKQLDGSQVMELIRREGGRATGARRIILEALARAGGRVTAEQLAESVSSRYPEIHQSTVYRTLERFESLGIAHHTHLGHGPAQWHLTGRPCSYLVCRHCGGVTEAEGAFFGNLDRRIRRQFGFEIDLQHFAITGTCSACRQQSG